jgi:hypothetical protein
MAASAEILRLVADARTHLPGSITTAIQAELFAAARDFFDFTNVWTEEITVPIVANDRTYTLTPAADGTILRLMTLFESTDIDKKPVAPCSMDIPGELVLGITPSAAATWVARVSKTVLDPVDGDGYPVFTAWIMKKYGDVLLAGTLGGMFSQGGKPYSDNKKADFYMRVFRSGKAKARVEAVKANIYGQTNWMFPSFAGGSQRGA